MNILSQIVGRCHVSMTDREVVRYVISRLRYGRLTFRSMTLKDRKQLVNETIRLHHENIELYAYVMNGWERQNKGRNHGQGKTQG